jgi:hypothetical protein
MGKTRGNAAAGSNGAHNRVGKAVACRSLGTSTSSPVSGSRAVSRHPAAPSNRSGLDVLEWLAAVQEISGPIFYGPDIFGGLFFRQNAGHFASQSGHCRLGYVYGERPRLIE